MRTALLLFSFLLLANFAQAQDDDAAQAAQAAQQASVQAMQASQQAMQDAMRANQQASDQMTQQMMNNLDEANRNAQAAPVIGITAKPKISAKPGAHDSPITCQTQRLHSRRNHVLHNSWLDSYHLLASLRRPYHN